MAIQRISRVKLRAVGGIGCGQEYVVERGMTRTFGNDPKYASFHLADPKLSLVHFVVDLGGEEALVRDLDSRLGTYLNGARIPSARLKNGDQISAGGCTWQVALESSEADRSGESLPRSAAKLLSEDRESVYALLDAAREPNLVPVAERDGFTCRSLFEGPEGDELSHVAPYLVELNKNSAELDGLMERAWGQRLAVFVSSSAPFSSIREHFRDKLIVQDEAGQDRYFRFYDPRVLASYLPTLTAAEAMEFFGPASLIRIEGGKPQVVEEYRCGAAGVTRREIAL